MTKKNDIPVEVEQMSTVEPFASSGEFGRTGASDVAKHDVHDDTGLLTVEEIAAIEHEVIDTLVKERKKVARKALMEKMLDANRAEAGESGREKVEIEIRTPAFAAIDLANTGIRIDGVPYLQGRRYKVSREKAELLREVMQRAWGHEEITFGRKDPNAYRRERNENQHGVPQTSGLLRF